MPRAMVAYIQCNAPACGVGAGKGSLVLQEALGANELQPQPRRHATAVLSHATYLAYSLMAKMVLRWLLAR